MAVLKQDCGLELSEYSRCIVCALQWYSLQRVLYRKTKGVRRKWKWWLSWF